MFKRAVWSLLTPEYTFDQYLRFLSVLSAQFSYPLVHCPGPTIVPDSFCIEQFQLLKVGRCFPNVWTGNDKGKFGTTPCLPMAFAREPRALLQGTKQTYDSQFTTVSYKLQFDVRVISTYHAETSMKCVTG